MQRRGLIAALGSAQVLVYGSSYYIPSVLAGPIAADTGWDLPWVAGGISGGLLVAGLLSPRVGRLIERQGGRLPLALSPVLLAAGLVLLTIAPTLPLYLAAWLVIGAGMGCGLYDAVFATLGRMYGSEARSAIASMTLVGGFSNTVAWPLSSLLLAHLGWRGTCMAWAAIDLFVVLPIYLGVLPRTLPPLPPRPLHNAAAGSTIAPKLPLLILLSCITTIAAALATTISMHLLSLLTASGLSAGAAVAFGATLGPAQVGGRLAEILLKQRHHPVWTMLAWTGLITLGLFLFWLSPAALPLAIACYGAGNGLGSIARGTVPLALFGPSGYAARMGKLAVPSLLAQAAAPVAGALLIRAAGPGGALGTLAALASVSLALTLLLIAVTWRQRRSAGPAPARA